MFSRIFEEKTKTYKEFCYWNFWIVPYFCWFKNQWNKVYFHSGPVYFWINLLFAVCVPHLHVNTLNYALIRFIQLWISRKPVDISRYISCINVRQWAQGVPRHLTTLYNTLVDSFNSQPIFWPLVFGLLCFSPILIIMWAGVVCLEVWTKVHLKKSSFENNYCCRYTRRPAAPSLQAVPSVPAVPSVSSVSALPTVPTVPTGETIASSAW